MINSRLFTMACFSALLAACASLKFSQGDFERLKKQSEYQDSLTVEEINSDDVAAAVRGDLSEGSDEGETFVQPAPTRYESPKDAPSLEAYYEANSEPSRSEYPQRPTASESTLSNSLAGSEEVVEEADSVAKEAPIQQMPFRMGERVTFALRYFGVRAGDLNLETLPFKMVNQEPAYHFKMSARSNRSFALVYTVDDFAETYVGVRNFRPFNYLISINQKTRVGENKALFDWTKGVGYTWERAITQKGEEKKDYEWEIVEGSQNVLSAIYYLRSFDLQVGEEYQFPVAHRGENLIMTAYVERREVINTDLGEFTALVIVPTFEIDGVFKQVGEIRIWLTDDDQKLPLQIQAKIKIGTINASLKDIRRGTPL